MQLDKKLEEGVLMSNQNWIILAESQDKKSLMLGAY
jgi:hypothetical protein